MIRIRWKGKIGYGDIVSPICYAHNVSHKLNTDVVVQFQWPHGPEQKIEQSDPETLWERADVIARLCCSDNTSVSVIHNFNDPIEYNHSNYDWDIVGKDQYHNYWYPTIRNKPLSNTVVVNTTEGNVVSLKQYGRPWKDPIANDWAVVRKLLGEKYNVVTVDYRTPIDTLVSLLRDAAGFVGYHGTAAWVAKFMHTPSIIFARGGKLTRNAFPYACIDSGDRVVFTVQNVEQMFQEASAATQTFVDKYTTYTPSEQFQLHLCHE